MRGALKEEGPGGWLAKLAWLAAGWVFVGVGAIGLVVPGLPGVLPLLIAAACFARGSERVHRWLVDSSVLGEPIRNWNEYHSISLRAKITAIVAMFGGLACVVFLSSLPTWAVVLTGCVIVVGMVTVLRLPHTTANDRQDIGESIDGNGL